MRLQPAVRHAPDHLLQLVALRLGQQRQHVERESGESPPVSTPAKVLEIRQDAGQGEEGGEQGLAFADPGNGLDRERVNSE